MGEQAVVGSLDDGAVEVEIRLTARHRLGPRRFYPTFIGLDLRKLLVGTTPSSQPGCCRLDRQAHLVQLAKVADIVAAFEVGVQPSDNVSIEEVPCPPRANAYRSSAGLP